MATPPRLVRRRQVVPSASSVKCLALSRWSRWRSKMQMLQAGRNKQWLCSNHSTYVQMYICMHTVYLYNWYYCMYMHIIYIHMYVYIIYTSNYIYIYILLILVRRRRLFLAKRLLCRTLFAGDWCQALLLQNMFWMVLMKLQFFSRARQFFVSNDEQVEWN